MGGYYWKLISFSHFVNDTSYLGVKNKILKQFYKYSAFLYLLHLGGNISTDRR